MNQARNSSRAVVVLLAALLVALGVWAYAPALRGALVFDDIPNIEQNRALQFDRWSVAALRRVATESPLVRRPLANLTFAFNVHGPGDRAFSLHATNLAIHLAASLLVFRWVWQASRLRPGGASAGAPVERSLLVGFLAAGLFAMHPVQTQAVSYVVQRMTSLAAMCYLAALCCYGEGRLASGRRRVAWLVGCAVAGVAALLSKEIAVTLPLAIGLYEFSFFSPATRDRSPRRGRVALAIVATSAALIAAAIAWVDPFEYYENREFSLVQRLLTQARVAWRYAGLVVWPLPSRLNLLHDVPTSRGLLEPPTTALALAGLTAYLAAIGALLRRNRAAAFLAIWPLLHLALESTLLPLEMMFEHRLYLPLAGTAFLAAWAYSAATARFSPGARWGAAIVLCVALASLTHERNRVWGDPLRLWDDVIAKSPALARPWINRAGLHAACGEPELAERDYRQALALAPADANVQLAWGTFELQRGRAAVADEAFSVCVEQSPNDVLRGLALRNRAQARLQLDRREEALADLDRALEIAPGDETSHYNRANLRRALGREDAALDDYRACLGINDRHVAALNNLAALLLEARDPRRRDAAEALALARRAAELSHEADWNVLDTLAAAYAARGDWASAGKWQSRALRLAPAEHQAGLRARLAQYDQHARQPAGAAFPP